MQGAGSAGGRSYAQVRAADCLKSLEEIGQELGDWLAGAETRSWKGRSGNGSSKK